MVPVASTAAIIGTEAIIGAEAATVATAIIPAGIASTPLTVAIAESEVAVASPLR